MGGTTAAPWTIPYPTGTDRVADGDNAMQALAERVAVISNSLPRGLIVTGATGADFVTGDSIMVTLAAFTTTEARDLMFLLNAGIGPYTAAPGTGIVHMIEKDGVNKTGATWKSWSAVDAIQDYAWSFIYPGVPAGVQNWRWHASATGSNGARIYAGSRFSIIDLGASGAI